MFDLDGVLVDSEIWWDQVRIEFAASVGRVWTAADREAVMGSNTRQWGERMRRLLQIELAEEEIQRSVIEGMLERYKRLGPPEIEGAAEAVRQLAARYPVAVASSAPRILIEAALDGLGVRSRLEEKASKELKLSKKALATLRDEGPGLLAKAGQG